MSSPSRSRAVTSTRSSRGSSFPTHVDRQQIHTAFNICLFPPLFFFCSLYYTDVGSTLFVLLFLKHFYDSHSQGAPTIFQSLVSVLLGLVALTFRQTNIFWVGVFPTGFLVIGGVAEKRIASRNSIDRNYTLTTQLQSLVEKSWRNGLLYDPSVPGAWLEGELQSYWPSFYMTRTDSGRLLSQHCLYCHAGAKDAHHASETASACASCPTLRHVARPVWWLCCLEWRCSLGYVM